MGQQTAFMALHGCSQLLTAPIANRRADLFAEAEQVRSEIPTTGHLPVTAPATKEKREARGVLTHHGRQQSAG